MKLKKVQLLISKLKKGIWGFSPSYGGFMLEALLICLNNFKHQNGINYRLNGDYNLLIKFKWDETPDAKMIGRWRDFMEAAQFGASAVTFLLARKLTKFTCLERSSIGTGFDFWLGNDDHEGIFQGKARLEISGILLEKGSNTLERRVLEKIEQTTQSEDTNLPAHICVSEFSNPKGTYITI